MTGQPAQGHGFFVGLEVHFAVGDPFEQLAGAGHFLVKLGEEHLVERHLSGTLLSQALRQLGE
jgi:hypothetical protein